ncbi:MAG TPA: hypothetical protein VMS81_02190 [Methanomicrobiales archaeon]|nr:hypothetical protein [Methanomicrobiales archaeon]
MEIPCVIYRDILLLLRISEQLWCHKTTILPDESGRGVVIPHAKTGAVSVIDGMTEMSHNLSHTITSFVNMDWLLGVCEQEILNERLIHEGIGGRINMLGQAELRGYIRAIRKVQELALLSIMEDVATLSCDDIGIDANGDLIISDGRIKMNLSTSEVEPNLPEEVQELIIQFDAIAPHPVIPRSRILSSKEYRKQPPGPNRSPMFKL